MNDLSTHLDDAAGDGPTDLDLAALHRRARTRRTRRRAGVAGSTLAAAALVLGVGFAIGGTDDAGPSSQLTAGEPVPMAPTDPGPSTTVDEQAPTSTTGATTAATDPGVPTTLAVTEDTVAHTTVQPTEQLPSTVDVAGTFASTPAPPFEIDPSRCPQIVSELDATLTLADGRTWGLREDGCGEILSEMTRYHGSGPFTITTGDGSTLTGSYESNAPLPTDGEPYTLTITDGTGEWSGATGTCTLDNQMETLPSGLVRQYGAFTCTIDVAPSSN